MQPSQTTQALALAYEQSQRADHFEDCLQRADAENGELTANLVRLTENLSAAKDRATHMALWQDALLHMTTDEAAALASDLDDMQAEWAKESARWVATAQTFSNAAHSAITASGIAVNVNEGLLARIAELEKELESARGYAAALEHDFGRLTTKEVEDLKASLAEQTRLRVAAFERNAQIEKELKAFTETPYSVRLEKQTRDAMTALRDVIGQQTDPALIRCLERIVTDLGAPTLPRHRFVELSV